MSVVEAKAKLSALIEAALRGETVVIAKAGAPVVRLVPFQTASSAQPQRLLAALGYQDVAIEAFAPEPDMEQALNSPLPEDP